MLIGPRGFGTRDASTSTWRLVAPRTDSIGVAPACCAVSASSRAAGAGHADQLGDGQDLVDLLARGLDGAGLADDVDHVRAKHALRMAEHGDGGGVRHVKAETGGVDQRAELG